MSFPSREALQKIQASGAFSNAHDFVVEKPTFVNTVSDDSFMKEFEGHTIQDAELDSSARDPPPRCHPGTRKEIVDRMQRRFRNPSKRWIWLVGQAGVGKSAIMQSLAELELESEGTILAALFFSAANGRNDPSKVIVTLAYQLAVRLLPYRKHMHAKVAADPKLFKKAIDKQFVDFIIEPFAEARLCQSPISIFIDGLDECKGQRSQLRFLDLISSFAITHPDVPLLWVVASRPESHITNHLSLSEIALTYDKEEVLVDSTESCKDVERYLRAELEKIRVEVPVIRSVYRQWPPEHQLLKLLAAALGHFAYADAVIRFISERSHVARFQLVLGLIDRMPSSTFDTYATQPMARLNALYQLIFSQVSPEDLPYTTDILTFSLSTDWIIGKPSISLMCNLLRMTPDVAYSALHQLHSVLIVPPPDKFDEPLKVYHKSFADFLREQIPGLPKAEADQRQWHLERTATFLNCIPLSSAPKAPAIPQDVLSWSYQDLTQVTRAKQTLVYYLTDLMFDQYDPIPIGSNAIMIHALKIALDICQKLRGDIFDESSELGRSLRRDGSLRDIPLALLDMVAIQKGHHDLVTYNDNGACNYHVADNMDIIHVKSAKEKTPELLVRVFIPNRLKGWVDCSAMIDGERRFGYPMKGVFLRYDFSTIYPALKGRFESSRVRQMARGMGNLIFRPLIMARKTMKKYTLHLVHRAPRG